VRYCGMDVHATSTVWCLVDERGEVVRQGRVATTAPALDALVRELGTEGELLAGQEVGTMTYLVYDTVTAAGATILSFNAQQLRMIAASRKKTDRRDAYWIAKALHAGMYPHPVYIPTGEIRELRVLLSRRRLLKAEHNRWVYRARAALRAAGHQVPSGETALRATVTIVVSAHATPPVLRDTLALCQRQAATLRAELRQAETILRACTRSIAAIGRLRTVPAIGPLAAATIYATVGDVHRFPSAKVLAAYAGLVPTVRQSGGSARLGGITKQGAPALRATLVQAAHVLLSRCRGAEATPLQAIGQRIHTSRGRRKIAIVALARHLLRIAYYILRDGTTYDAQRLGAMTNAA
jgi:transposase